MIRTNLKTVERRSPNESVVYQLAMGIVALVVTVLVCFAWTTAKIRKAEHLHQQVIHKRKELTRLRNITREVEALDETRKALDSRVEVLDQVQWRRTLPATFMEELSERMHPRIWLLEVKESGDEIVLVGTAVDHGDYGTLIYSLRKSPHFARVQLTWARSVYRPFAWDPLQQAWGYHLFEVVIQLKAPS